MATEKFGLVGSSEVKIHKETETAEIRAQKGALDQIRLVKAKEIKRVILGHTIQDFFDDDTAFELITGARAIRDYIATRRASYPGLTWIASRIRGTGEDDYDLDADRFGQKDAIYDSNRLAKHIVASNFRDAWVLYKLKQDSQIQRKKSIPDAEYETSDKRYLTIDWNFSGMNSDLIEKELSRFYDCMVLALEKLYEKNLMQYIDCKAAADMRLLIEMDNIVLHKEDDRGDLDAAVKIITETLTENGFSLSDRPMRRYNAFDLRLREKKFKNSTPKLELIGGSHSHLVAMMILNRLVLMNLPTSTEDEEFIGILDGLIARFNEYTPEEVIHDFREFDDALTSAGVKTHAGNPFNASQ